MESDLKEIKRYTLENRTIVYYYDIKESHMLLYDSKFDTYKNIKIQVSKNRNYGRWNYKVNNKTYGVGEIEVNMLLMDFGSIKSNKNYKWSDVLIIKYLKEKYVITPTYNLLSTFDINTPEKSIYKYFRKRGGIKKYYTLLKDNNMKTNDIIYRDSFGNVFRSYYEFVFSCYCEYNNITYEYESIKVENMIPDFYLPSKKLICEIIGYNINDKDNSTIINIYKNRLLHKEQIYKKLDLDVNFINIIKKDVDKCIYNNLIKYFSDIKKPNIMLYYQKNCIEVANIEESIFEYLHNYNSTLIKKPDNIYKHIIKKYGTLYNAISTVLNIIPNKKIRKPSGYWYNIDSCISLLKDIKSKYGYIPARHIAMRDNITELCQLYKVWGGGKKFKEKFDKYL